MRTKIVTVAGKDINVQEKRIGELEKLIADLFPGSKGKIGEIQKAFSNIELDWELLYEKLPVIFPDLTTEDIKNAYMSELENIFQAFIDVNFFGLKTLVKQMTRLAQIGLTQK